MNREEQKVITEFVDRTVSGVQTTMDVEADAIIRALFARNPDAAYRMTMLAMTLTTAQLTQPAMQAAQPARQRRWLGGLFGKKNRSSVAA